MSDGEIESLSNRIKTLEIDNEKLKLEVHHLKKALKNSNADKARTTANNHHNESFEVEHSRARRGIHLDRHKKRLDLEDEVYIITPGAHTNRSRRGRVTGFHDIRNRVFVLDEKGVTQERASKNLKLERKGPRGA